MMFDTIADWIVWLDDRARFWDLAVHRTVNGPLDRWLGIDRHTLTALVLPALMCALLVLASPSPSRIGNALVTIAVSAALLAVWMRRSAQRGWPLCADLAGQILLVLAVAALVWWTGPNEYRSTGPYRHLLVPVATALAVAVGVSALIVDALFKPLRIGSEFGHYLRRTELFASRGATSKLTFGSLLTAVLTVPLRAPMAVPTN